MNTKAARALVLEALAEVAPDVEPADLDPGASLREGGELDSMDFVAFVACICDAIGRDIPEDHYARLDGLDKAAAYVAERA